MAAKLLFDRVLLEMRNVVTWTVMVDGFEPDEVTLASVLSACAQLG